MRRFLNLLAALSFLLSACAPAAVPIAIAPQASAPTAATSVATEVPTSAPTPGPTPGPADIKPAASESIEGLSTGTLPTIDGQRKMMEGKVGPIADLIPAYEYTGAAALQGAPRVVAGGGDVAGGGAGALRARPVGRYKGP